MADNSKTTINLEDMKELIASAVTAAVAAANAPKPLTDKEIKQIELDNQMRAENAAGVLAAAENKRNYQKICTHEHPSREHMLGKSHCVHVKDNDYPYDPGYIYCQKCEARVRPESERWRKLDPTAHFDTALFNRLYQDVVVI
jgi:hypothetical protein